MCHEDNFLPPLFAFLVLLAGLPTSVHTFLEVPLVALFLFFSFLGGSYLPAELYVFILNRLGRATFISFAALVLFYAPRTVTLALDFKAGAVPYYSNMLLWFSGS